MKRLCPIAPPALWLAALLALLLPAVARAQLPDRNPDLVLRGEITGADHQSYKQIPFELPKGTARLVVAFDYEGREQKTVIDLGIMDPDGFRGASGGNKPSFTIAASDATPSYLPGPLKPGTWQLALAVPSIRQGSLSRWTARLWFLKNDRPDSLPPPTAGRGPGWYRGDLHMHSAHSDGSCISQSGKRVPCPLFKTLEAAAARGLDFIAVTEHNTTTHHAPLREAQPYFDKMLLIPGREITTFQGHFNIFGVTAPIDFRIAKGIDNSFNRIADRVHAEGGLVSINHPTLPSGEACMGCGWTMPDVDYTKVDAIEVVNGGTVAATAGLVESPVSGIPFWRARLSQGIHQTAVGGSDNHDAPMDAAKPGAIGRPTTVVHAEDLTTAAILEGIRKGRVFVDITGDANTLLDMAVAAGDRTAPMGGKLLVSRNAKAKARIEVTATPSTRLELLDALSGKLIHMATLERETQVFEFALGSIHTKQVIHAQVRSPDGKLIMLGNAIEIGVR